MRYQLRVYRAKPGKLDDFVREWRALVVPLRERFGFQVEAAWRGDDGETFAWLVGYKGAGSFEDADAAYYASEERRSFDPDPARHIAQVDVRNVRPLP